MQWHFLWNTHKWPGIRQFSWSIASTMQMENLAPMFHSVTHLGPVINPAAMNCPPQFSLCWRQFSLGWEVNFHGCWEENGQDLIQELSICQWCRTQSWEEPSGSSRWSPRGEISLWQGCFGGNTVLCCPEGQTDDWGTELLQAESFGFLFSASL